MGEVTKIEWTHHTFNPWIGCNKIDPLCDHCYAHDETFTRVQRGRGRELWGADADRHITSADNWKKPLRWARDAEAAGERRRVFCASLADVCEDRRDLDSPREWLWTLIRLTADRLDWMLLTKRPQNITGLIPPDVCRLVWLGVSAGTIAGLKRIELLMLHRARCRFVSMEPLLEDTGFDPMDARYRDENGAPVDLVIVGGESGPERREMRSPWVRALRDRCALADVAFFFKQRIDERGNKVSLPLLDGRQWAEIPGGMP